MNNNNINLEENKEVKIDLAYIMNKIDEINEMNAELISRPVQEEMIPITKSICETNNKTISLLQKMCESMLQTESVVLKGLIDALEEAIDMNAGIEVVSLLTDVIANFSKK